VFDLKTKNVQKFAFCWRAVQKIFLAFLALQLGFKNRILPLTIFGRTKTKYFYCDKNAVLEIDKRILLEKNTFIFWREFSSSFQ
jgi:hypothetical protein